MKQINSFLLINNNFYIQVRQFENNILKKGSKCSLKIIASCLLSMFIFSVNAQKKWDTTERIYKNGVYMPGLYDVGKEKFLDIVPTGKNVNVVYDPYYNSYKIDWNESGTEKQMILKPSRETPKNGIIFIDTYAPVENQKNEYFIIDEIIKKGSLQVIYVKTITDEGKTYKLCYFFEDLN